jgi:Zn finger protein HypA/HybF involved in hydrogenase expression
MIVVRFCYECTNVSEANEAKLICCFCGTQNDFIQEGFETDEWKIKHKE